MPIATQSSQIGSTRLGKYYVLAVLAVVFLILAVSQPANALPAFARKYGLRCSACHESWPMLNTSARNSKITATS